jgi:nucleoside triphosphate diphosphatase
MTPSREITRLLDIMKRLRDPETGCAWDIVQTFESIAPHTLEEAYEVLDAIARKDTLDLKEELGDLLLQVVFHAQIASEADEQSTFDFGDVVEGITQKLIRRHPHIFADTTASTPEAVKIAWDAIKAQEKSEKARERARLGLPVPPPPTGLLSAIPAHLPALQRAQKLTQKAATIGFDWDNPHDVIAKIREELQECEEALESGHRDAIEDELGDLLFAIINLARHAHVNPEQALTRTNLKFITRFSHIEQTLTSQGRTLQEASLAEMEDLWQQAKNQKNET